VNALKVQIITTYSLEKTPPVKNRIIPIIKSYHDLGCEVELISGDLSSLSNKYKEAWMNKRFKHKTVKPIGASKKNFLFRAIEELYLSFRIFLSSTYSNTDIKVITIPSMFLTVPLIFFTKESKIVIDIRDLTWEYLKEDSILRRMSKKILRWLISKGLKHADIYTVTNKKELRYIEKLSPKSKCFLLFNGISHSRFKDLVHSETNAISQKIKVGYVGTVGIAQNLITLVKAAKENPHIEFKIVGEGADMKSLINFSEKNNLSNIAFLGSLSWKEISKFYDEIDVLYANISSNYATAVPSKIFEYIAVGKPIIFGSIGESREILKDFRGVMLIQPDDLDQLLIALDSCCKTIDQTDVEYNRLVLRENYLRENTCKLVASKVVKHFKLN